MVRSCIIIHGVIQLVLQAAHNSTWHSHSTNQRDPELPNDVSLVYSSGRMRQQCPPRSMKKLHLNICPCWVLLKLLNQELGFHLSFGPAGPGFSSGSWMVVHSYYFADDGSSVRDLTGQHRSQRSLFQSKLVLTGSRFFTNSKNGRWEFQCQFPFWKALRNLYLNSHKEVHLYFRGKLLVIVCTACRNLQRYFCQYCFYSSFCNFLSQHREAQWMSYFNYCVILPFDFVRMSYNVGIAKSVLFVKYVTILCIVT